MPSIIILIIFIYFIFVLFQFNTCQQFCSKYGQICDINSKCCKGLNCKLAVIKDGRPNFKCVPCVQEGNFCVKKGRICCYGYKCVDNKCTKCTTDKLKCNGPNECCSGICDEIPQVGVPRGSAGLPGSPNKVCVNNNIISI
ncbi:unnamed protein product [Meloidogyne enterolobii]|uniref:Uncharacterized protein n=1 Tax=Meloidogyne enterolobii TaxID=390850 RepID=A0ACB0Z5T2_MELEN